MWESEAGECVGVWRLNETTAGLVWGRPAVYTRFAVVTKAGVMLMLVVRVVWAAEEGFLVDAGNGRSGRELEKLLEAASKGATV